VEAYLGSNLLATSKRFVDEFDTATFALQYHIIICAVNSAPNIAKATQSASCVRIKKRLVTISSGILGVSGVSGVSRVLSVRLL
jgi:hypothetical protein